MIKTSILNKDIAYSLHNIENFKKNIEPSINEVVYTYYHLIVEYFKFITENIKIRNKPLTQFIITRGLDTITHVFLNLLYFTKNIDLTYFHSQKSFYFYVEFVGQISEEEKMFLQLSSRDAATYVYKKTIFEINNECKKNIVAMSEETKHKLDLISIYINIYKTFIYKIIIDHSTSGRVPNKYITIFAQIATQFYNMNNSYTVDLPEKVYICRLQTIIDTLYYKISNIESFFDICELLIKKFVKKPSIIKNCEKKIYTEECDVRLQDTIGSDKFITWLLH